MRPKSVEASKSRGELFIRWEDDHESRYPLAGLRAACPCAECRGGHEAMGQPVTPELMTSRPVEGAAGELVSLEAVGNYAVAFTWKDGHSTGLFTFRMLQDLCPCEACGGEKR